MADPTRIVPDVYRSDFPYYSFSGDWGPYRAPNGALYVILHVEPASGQFTTPLRVYKSLDDGSTWSLVCNLLPFALSSNTNYNYVASANYIDGVFYFALVRAFPYVLYTFQFDTATDTVTAPAEIASGLTTGVTDYYRLAIQRQPDGRDVIFYSHDGFGPRATRIYEALNGVLLRTVELNNRSLRSIFRGAGDSVHVLSVDVAYPPNATELYHVRVDGTTLVPTGIETVVNADPQAANHSKGVIWSGVPWVAVRRGNSLVIAKGNAPDPTSWQYVTLSDTPPKTVQSFQWFWSYIALGVAASGALHVLWETDVPSQSVANEILSRTTTEGVTWTETSSLLNAGFIITSFRYMHNLSVAMSETEMIIMFTLVGCLNNFFYRIPLAPPGPSPVADCSNPPDGQVGVAYAHTVTASGGTPPYSFAVVGGSLPDGLAMDAAGAITGTPTLAGVFTFTVRVTDNTAATADVVCSITITALAADCADPPDGAVGAAYTHQLAATGGTPPYSFAIVAGALPDGLGMNVAGLISGTPTTPGVFTFTIRATDSAAQTGEAICTITIWELLLDCDDPPGGTVGVPYAHAVVVSGGVPPYSVALLAGALPPGLLLSADGEIAGIPTLAGEYTFTLRATDSAAPTHTADAICSITIVPWVPPVGQAEVVCSITITAPVPLAVDCADPPGGQIGYPYSHQLAASGGVPPYSFAIIAGALPPGLTMDAAGLITGIPTRLGVFTFTVEVTDADGATATVVCTIAIVCPDVDAPAVGYVYSY
jgi:hypothetical protein